MIKGISFLRPAGSAAAYDRLASFFARWGLRRAVAGRKKSNRGASFLAPIGNLGICRWRDAGDADVCIEVTALDAVHQAAAAWFRGQGHDRVGPLLRDHRDALEVAHVHR